MRILLDALVALLSLAQASQPVMLSFTFMDERGEYITDAHGQKISIQATLNFTCEYFCLVKDILEGNVNVQPEMPLPIMHVSPAALNELIVWLKNPTVSTPITPASIQATNYLNPKGLNDLQDTTSVGAEFSRLMIPHLFNITNKSWLNNVAYEIYASAIEENLDGAYAFMDALGGDEKLKDRLKAAFESLSLSWALTSHLLSQNKPIYHNRIQILANNLAAVWKKVEKFFGSQPDKTLVVDFETAAAIGNQFKVPSTIRHAFIWGRQVTQIGSSFLSGCRDFQSVDLSCLTSVTRVGDWFLAHCNNLTSIRLPSGDPARARFHASVSREQRGKIINP